MPNTENSASSTSNTSRKTPASLREHENRLVGMAMREAERQIEAGTASSQLLTHYLKLGTTRERLEQEKMKHEAELAQAKIQNYAQQEKTQEMFEAAINAMKEYKGSMG